MSVITIEQRNKSFQTRVYCTPPAAGDEAWARSAWSRDELYAIEDIGEMRVGLQQHV
jgi:hypothetical protein